MDHLFHRLLRGRLMRIPLAWLLAALACLVPGTLMGPVTLAQDAGEDEVADAGDGAALADDLGEEPYRRLAPGVERTIPPDSQHDESFSRHDMLDVLAEDATYGERPWSPNIAKQLRYTHDIWALEFTFKPVRFIEVDLPNDEGKFDRKQIWYLIYRVRNVSDEPVTFVPRLLLHSWDTDKYYPDRLIPLAQDAIRRREDPRRVFLNSVEMSDAEIPPSTEDEALDVWGVATWEDVDPRTDRFAVYVQGLTNAYRWSDDEERASGKRRYYRKTLQLNFYRPSDDRYEHEREIRFGMQEQSLTAAEVSQARKRAGWTRQELAEKLALDVTAADVTNWETAKAAVPAAIKPQLNALIAPYRDPVVDYRWLYK
jgi:hypothetical protein